MATGQNLLQRFYYRQSLTNDHPSTSHRHFKCDAFSVAMGCLFLSCKIEESPRRPRDVVAVFHRMAFRRKGLEPEILDYVSDVRTVSSHCHAFPFRLCGDGRTDCRVCLDTGVPLDEVDDVRCGAPDPKGAGLLVLQHHGPPAQVHPLLHQGTTHREAGSLGQAGRQESR